MNWHRGGVTTALTMKVRFLASSRHVIELQDKLNADMCQTCAPGSARALGGI